MGCDIHIRIQVQEQGQWKTVPYVEEPWFERGKYEYSDKDWAAYDKATHKMPKGFENRNYNLFGILADVRNGSGFAGCDTGDAWPALAARRGLPDDVREDGPHDDCDANDAIGEVWLGDHSYTWIGLEELEAAKWDEIIREGRGLVDAETFQQWDGKSVPYPHCGGVSGPKITITTPTEYREIQDAIAKHGLISDQKYYIQCAWKVSAREATFDWPGKMIPALKVIAAGRPLRLVMGFDS